MAMSRAIRSPRNCHGPIRTWRLPVERLARLVEEHEFDLYNDPMPSLAALEGYANDTTSTLFACCARILARPSETIDHLARHAGLAYAMIEVINTLPQDIARQQLFVPLQFLRAARQQPRRGAHGQADPADPARGR